MVFRFGNSVFEPIWNRRYIEYVQITVAEELGVELRGGYYDHSGVVRDMVQNHILSVLSLIAMEPPSSISGDSVRNEKVKVLEAIRPMEPEEVIANTVRGQYGAGSSMGKRFRPIAPSPTSIRTSNTETFVAMKLEVENWRWAEVPFYIRSGKRLAAHTTQIVIGFRRAPSSFSARTFRATSLRIAWSFTFSPMKASPWTFMPSARARTSRSGQCSAGFQLFGFRRTNRGHGLRDACSTTAWSGIRRFSIATIAWTHPGGS